jgi:TonB family protein
MPRGKVTSPAVHHVDVKEITEELSRDTAGALAGDAAATSYQAMLEARIQAALEAVPGLDDGLRGEVTFEILPNGRIAHVALSQRSGDEHFDRAVLETVSALDLPPPPPSFARLERIPIATRARR